MMTPPNAARSGAPLSTSTARARSWTTTRSVELAPAENRAPRRTEINAADSEIPRWRRPRWPEEAPADRRAVIRRGSAVDQPAAGSAAAHGQKKALRITPCMAGSSENSFEIVGMAMERHPVDQVDDDERENDAENPPADRAGRLRRQSFAQVT
jgi:hypothetical protein